MVDPQMGTRDIWIFDVRRALSERFTSDPSDDFSPVWSPRGDHVIFSSARSGRIDLYQKSEATGVEQRIDDRGLNLGKFAASWSRTNARFSSSREDGRLGAAISCSSPQAAER